MNGKRNFLRQKVFWILVELIYTIVFVLLLFYTGESESQLIFKRLSTLLAIIGMSLMLLFWIFRPKGKKKMLPNQKVLFPIALISVLVRGYYASAKDIRILWIGGFLICVLGGYSIYKTLTAIESSSKMG
ncbi:hypothetical protein HMPREF1987_01678 [Peptostreptococcaceae bacterium oral taxon 113 str. W5053]|nr:hypothetical protein HMPREF1987_01678 [Peptostreptococcaceae bacterium oral taxon 113 str. W5053]